MDVINAMPIPAVPAMPTSGGNGFLGIGENPEMPAGLEFGTLFQQCLGLQNGQMQTSLLDLPKDLQNTPMGAQMLDSKELAMLNQLVGATGESSDTNFSDNELVAQLQALLGQLQTLLEQAQQPEFLPQEIQELTDGFAEDFRDILSRIGGMEITGQESEELQNALVELQDQIVQNFEQLIPYLPKESMVASPLENAGNENSMELGDEEMNSPPPIMEGKENKTDIKTPKANNGKSEENSFQAVAEENSSLENSNQDQENLSQQNPESRKQVDFESPKKDQKSEFVKLETEDVEIKSQLLDGNETNESSETVELRKAVDLKPVQGEPVMDEGKPQHVQSQSNVSDSAKIQEPVAPRVFVAERIQQHTSVHQVAHKIQYMVQNGDGKAVLRLDPPELGHIEIEVDTSPGEMRIHMKVDNESVKQIMESSVANLRESLEQQNVKLEKLEVQVDSAKAEAQAKGQENPMHRRQNGKGGRGMRFADIAVEQPQSDTGRRLGYNTMELIA